MENAGSVFEDSEKTFIELSNSQRLQIINALTHSSMNLTLIAKHLGITMQEAHRNFNRLMDAGIVSKDSSGSYSLTTFGNTIVTQIPSINFLSKNKNYFSDHYFADLPMKFVQRIGSLDNSKFIQGLVAVIEEIKEMYRFSEEYIYGMIPQVPLDLMEVAAKTVKERKIKFNYILPKNAAIPKKGKDFLNEINYQELLKNGLVERKMIEDVRVSVVLNEKKALVMFPSIKGETDMNGAFSNSIHKENNKLFHEWCLDYFRYCWLSSKPFDNAKLREV
ncbi:MAG TPA: transcriptional regulator [Nitrososphaeraceae archaeon]|nr:transcriptional regulator [Nitrososphaeraceae archaeon]